MAMKVEELQVIISANADQFKGQLTSIEKQISGLPKGMGAVASAGTSMGASVLSANIAFAVLAGGVMLVQKGIEALGDVIKDSITTTQKYESALIGLETVAGRKLGFSAVKDANQSAKDLASDGLMSVQDAAKGLKNLLASGFSLDQANNLMKTFKDSAAFGRQSALSFGEAVSSATEGIKNGNSILVDNAGITKNLSVILAEAGFSAQDLSRATSDVNVRQALYNGLMREGNLFQGDSARLLGTTAGQMALLEARMTNLQVSIGQAVKPIQMALNAGVIAFLNGIQLTIDGTSVQIGNVVNKLAGFILAVIRAIGRLLSSIPIIGKNFTAMANVTLTTAKTQERLKNDVSNTGGALDKTAGSASKLKKELMGLAAFDEMNVLTAGAGAGGVGGAGALNLGSLGGGDAGSFGLDTTQIEDARKVFESAFQAIGDKISTFLQPIIKGLGDVWSWLNTDIIQPVVAFWNRELVPIFTYLGFKVMEVVKVFQDEWVKIEPVIKPLFDAVTKLASEGFDRLGKVISLIWENVLKPFGKWFLDTLVENIKTGIRNIGAIMRFLDPIFTGIVNFISGAMNWIWKAIKDVANWISGVIADIAFFFWKLGRDVSNVWGGVLATLSSVWEVIKIIFKAGVNAVIDTINGIIRAVNRAIGGISGLSEAMGKGSITFRVGELPRLAQGGIVNSPTVAMIGEAGREAVVPLDNTKWIDELASKINNSSNGQGGNITIKLGEEKIYSKFIDYVNDRSKATNSLVFNI